MLLPPPLTRVQATDPAQKIEALQKAQQWGSLCDFFETLSPKERGENLSTWLQSLQRAGHWLRLVEVCDAVIPQLESKSGPRLGIARLERAQALSALNQHAEAEATHEENGKLGYPDGHPNACIEARNVQDWGGLQRNATALVALNGKNLQAMAWNNLGRCLVAKQAWAEAAQVLDTALKLDPASREAPYNRGLATFQMGRYDEALSDLKAAAAAQPGDPRCERTWLQPAPIFIPASERRAAQKSHERAGR